VGEGVTMDLTRLFRERLRCGEKLKLGHWGAGSHASIARALQQKIVADGLIER